MRAGGHEARSLPHGGFHAKAWVAWVAAASVTIISLDNPFATATALGALLVVAAGFGSRAPEGRSIALFLKFGVIFLLLRVLLFGLTGHTGDTTVFTLPAVALPTWLGGFAVGGRVTAEVVAQQAADGAKIATFLVCFGVFLAVVETYRVLRLLPRFLFEAGLVVSIALAFVPVMLRRASDVRDAQRLRGHRFRGLRSLRPVVVPVIADGLERSLTLAASMESRGYGRARSEGTDARARLWVLAGMCALTAGGGFALFGRRSGIPVAVAGAIAIGLGLHRMSRAVERTRFRPDPLVVWDIALITASVVAAAAAIAVRALPAAHWYAYPAVHQPAFDLRLIVVAASIAAPAAIAAARSARIARIAAPADEHIAVGATR